MDNEVKVAPGLNDLPDEVLLPLMSCLNDISLLDMTSVCKRFERIAKEAFTLKYNGATEDDYYRLNINSANLIYQHTQYQPFFSMFGKSMVAIRINFRGSDTMGKDHWVIGCIQRYCTSLAKIYISNAKQIDLTGMMPKPTLTHLSLDDCSILNSWAGVKYPKLIYFYVEWVSIEKQKLDEFIDNNRQLQELHLIDESIDKNILHSISGKLNDLTTLSIRIFECLEFLPAAGTIDLPKLKKLDLECDTISDTNYVSVFQSIRRGCHSIAELNFEVMNDYIQWNDQLINAVCEFNQLKALRLCAKYMKMDHIEQIIQKIENLSSLCLSNFDMDETFDNASEVISICSHSKLKKLEIEYNIFIYHSDYVYELNFDFLFLIRIAEITESNAGLTITLKPYDSLSSNKIITSTRGEVRCGDAIVYWRGYDPMLNRTKLTLLDLGDKCMEKIIGYLGMNALSALYNTCTQTQKAVKDHVLNTEFHVPAYSIKEDALQCLAPSIRRLIIEYDLSSKHCELIDRYCTNVIELKIIHPIQPTIHGTNISLPKLKKLIFGECALIDFKTLRSFDCPLLSYLEVSRFKTKTSTIDSARVLYLDDSFRYLTVLKFGNCNESVEKFFKGLNERVCNQLKEVSLGSISSLRENLPGSTIECHMGIINVVARCRNLNALHLIIPDIEGADLWFLFENCTKLTDFTVYYTNYYESQKMFQLLKENCKDIKSIKIVIRGFKSETFLCSFLKKIFELFPDVSITVAYVDTNSAFPLTQASVVTAS